MDDIVPYVVGPDTRIIYSNPLVRRQSEEAINMVLQGKVNLLYTNIIGQRFATVYFGDHYVCVTVTSDNRYLVGWRE